MAERRNIVRKKIVATIASLIPLIRSLLQTTSEITNILNRIAEYQRILLKDAIEDHSRVLAFMRDAKRKINQERRRQHWVAPSRTDQWWKTLIFAELPEEEWYRSLRMNCETFMTLVNEIRNDIRVDENSFRQDAVTTEKRVAMVLYYLKDQGSYRMIANCFGVSLPTLSKSLRMVCRAINAIMGPKLINFPKSNDEINEAISFFEQRFRIPMCIGCVNGTHISIRKPPDNSQDYFCYKMKYTLNVQAIYDHKGFFTDVEINWPGSVHDARVYSNSNINKLFKSSDLPRISKELTPGSMRVSPFLLGDPAYPLLPNLLKEYANCLKPKEVYFNNCLRSARNQIESAYERLKARWRILNRSIDVDIDFASDLIHSCFILHNFCERNNVDIGYDTVQQQLQIDQRCQSCNHHSQFDHLYSYNSNRGKMVHDTVCEFLWDNDLR